jgi:uncharacterized membrane protein YphA (DoxX/SURF4 family)
MNYRLTIVLRSLLGLIFVAAPAAAIFHTVEPALPTQAAAFTAALAKTGYMMPLLWSTEIVAGLMLLSGILVPIALLLLAPVVVNIALFHALLAPAGAGPAAVVIGLQIFLAWEYRRAFEPLFVLRAGFGRPRDRESFFSRTSQSKPSWSEEEHLGKERPGLMFPDKGL